jgi:excisionase family DNA binding protein
MRERISANVAGGAEVLVAQRLLNVKEAARYIGRTEKSVRHLVSRRKLRCVRADGRVMLDLSDLDAWITMNVR